MFDICWLQAKELLNENLQYRKIVDAEQNHYLFIYEGPMVFKCILYGQNLTEYEANYAQ